MDDSTLNNTPLDFDYVDLNEVDPNQTKIPENAYTLKVLNAELINGISKKSGEPYKRVDFTFAIVDDETFSGRRLWDSLFQNESSLKRLRRLMDATGVQQTPGTTLSEWLKELTLYQPSFKAEVTLRVDPRQTVAAGVEPEKINRVNLWSAVPV